MSKQQEALRLALEALETNNKAWKSLADSGDAGWWDAEEQSFYELSVKAITAIREALADSALDRMAENARELGLDYEPPCKTGSQCTSKCQQCDEPAQQQKEGFASPGGGYVPAIPRPIPLDWKLVPRKATPEMLRAMDECAQEGYDERLYAGMASSVYMAAWDASPVMGTLPEQPAQQPHCNDCGGFDPECPLVQPAQQQEPVAWYDEEYDCAYTAAELDGGTVDGLVPLYTSPPASKPWVGLTEEEVDECYYWKGRQWTTDELVRHVEAKLREKNALESNERNR